METNAYVLRLFVLSVLASGALAQLFSANSPRVELADGKLRGKHVLTRESKKIRAFLGIPYAKPPVDELRFKSPEPPEPWEKERLVVDHPKPCVQPDKRHGAPIGREDCLYLNVYTPEGVPKPKILNSRTRRTSKEIEDEAKEKEVLSNEVPDSEGNEIPMDIAVLNGTSINGTTKNATTINSTDLSTLNINGTAFNLTSLNGNIINGTVINGTVINGTVINGTMVNGTNANETKHTSCPLLPVMVFFHGGAFEMGHSEPFSHEYLLDVSVVVVTVQYRLGILGFLSTGDEALPGNMGLKDQRLALKWVQENIERFGGCPEKVTIFGDGVGGASVHYHLLFSQNKNELFRAGISMSGTALSPWAFRSPSEVAHTVDRLSHYSNCPRDSQKFVECMKRKRPDDFVVMLQKYKNESRGGCGEWALSMPMLGGVLESPSEDAFITASPWAKKVILPWIVGVTSKELLYEFTSHLVDRKDRLFKELDKCFNKTLPRVLGYQFSNASDTGLVEGIREFYFKNQPIRRDIFADVVDAVSDGSVVYPTFEAVRRAGRRSTWLYHFNFIGTNTYGATSLDGRIAPGRGDDLFFFFPRPLGKNVPRKNKEPDTAMSRKLVKLWTNFATYLDPTPAEVDGLKWAPVTPSTTFLNIGQENMTVERPFQSFRMNFWSLQDFPHRDDDFGAANTKPLPEANSAPGVMRESRVGHNEEVNINFIIQALNIFEHK